MAYSSKVAKSKKRLAPRRGIVLIAILVLLVAVGIAALYHQSKSSDSASHVATSKKVTPRPASEKITTPAPTSSKTSSSTSTGTAPTNVVLTKPFGTLVSNHKPGQNNSPLEEASVCNTTPGASCSITFTKDGVTKSLSAKQSDSSGAVYWSSWTPQSVGLSSGNWTVAAVATLGQQSETTQDPNPLQVSP